MNIRILSFQKNNPITCSSCRGLIPFPFGEIVESPAILGCSQSSDIKQDKFFNFWIYVCSFCGLIQTDTCFNSVGYGIVHSHALGGVWAEHRNRLLEFILESRVKRLGKIETALEIGPSVSPILRNMSQDILHIQYIDLVDEAPFKLASNEQYEKQHFPSTQLHGKFDLIVASHVLEHAESISGFMEAIKYHLAENGIAVLSIPNFYEWLKNKYWNAITPEHLNYPFVKHIQDLCFRLGLDVEFMYFKLHSVFMRVSCLTKAKLSIKTFQGSNRENTLKMLEDWVIEINSKIAEYEKTIGDTAQEVILVGASHLSQYMVLISELIRSRVKIVLDNSLDKHGERLYGTELIVHPFDIVKKFQSPMVIIPYSPYSNEMIAQVLKLNASSKIIS